MTADKKRIVLITGASSGFGQACMDYLARKEYRVYGTSRRAEMPDKSDYGDTDGSIMIPMDVTSSQSIQYGLNRILENEGRLDVVVNNAGIGVAGAVEDTSTTEMQMQFDTNFFGVFRVCRAVLPIMRGQGGGYIVNVSSIAGLIGTPFQAGYAASKFAVEGLTEALRLEVSTFGINVSLIEPGDFRTGFTENRVFARKSKPKSPYNSHFKRVLTLYEKSELNGPSPELLPPLLEKIINHPSPRLRYSIGPESQRLSILLKRLLPEKVFQGVLKSYFQS